MFSIINKFPNEFGIDEKGKLYCLLCSKPISFDKKHGKDRVNVHRNSKKHRQNLKLSKPQQLITTSVMNIELNMNKNEYYMDLARMLVEADIPIDKLNNEKFKCFMTKWTKKCQPSAWTIRNYVPFISEEKINKIKAEIKSKFIYLQVDETTDSAKHYVLNVMASVLDGNEKTMLVLTKFLEKTNNLTVQQGILDALNTKGL